MTSRIDQTIESIVAGAAPVRLARPWLLLLGWLAATFAGTCAIVLFLAPRHDLALQLASPLFLAEAATLAALVITSGAAGVWLGFPDMRQQRAIPFAPVPFLLLYVGLLGYRLMHPELNGAPAPEEHGINCALCIAIFAVIPGLWMFRLLRRNAPAHPRLAGAIALLAASSTGHLVLKFAESDDSVLHFAESHLLPMLALAILGAFLGRKYLSW
ncbi:MAG: DUF1109 family protein [Alphaproteobacteria bacterium]|nr:DUF1109 family protein [Alphaproteobacteria bacterium]